MPLGLPATPVELKAITSYLQRADELQTQEPVVAYWCLYHAAQTGIGTKANAPDSKAFLGDMLGVLEGMKGKITASNPEANETIDSDSASAAYVENFALKIFGGADEEDRRGEASRATAKKFLAAAQFLELLKVFGAAGQTEADAEKIRYAKWKAADIAKAFREGRKPVAGPAGGLPSPQLPSAPTDPAVTPDPMLSLAPSTAPSELGSEHPFVPPILTPPAGHFDEPPESPPQNRPTFVGQSLQLPHGLSNPQKVTTPGSWSTSATPGAGYTPDANHMLDGPFVPSAIPGAPGVALAPGGPAILPSNGSVPASTVPDSETSGQKSVHFTPSIDELHPVTPQPINAQLPTAPARSSTPKLPAVGQVPPATTRATVTPFHQPSQLGSGGGGYGGPDSAPPVLSNAQVSRVQKHCRFAISALDYEDPEQARKELRAALAILGG